MASQRIATLGDSFSVRAARAAGMTRGQLRSSALEQPFHGVRMIAPAAKPELSRLERERADALRRIRAYAQIMPAHAFFIGPTAAVITGAPLPPDAHDVLHVGVFYPATPPRRRGIRGVRLQAAGVRVVERDGLRVVDQATMWMTLADALGDYDLVAVADHLLRVPRRPGGFGPPDRGPLLTREELAARIDARRRPGAARMRSLLERARTGASSRPETWVRLAIVDGGLPEPELDVDVFDRHGEFIACLDAAYPRLRLGLEFDGAWHRGRRQWSRDVGRHTSLVAEGWSTLRFAAEDVFADTAGVARAVRDALTERGVPPP